MKVEDKIFAALGPLVGGRAYPLSAPPDVARPYIVFSRTDGQKEYTVAGPTDATHRRVQVDLYDDEDSPYDDIVALMDAVEAALHEQLAAVLVGDGLERVVATRMRQARQDFLLWDRR